MNEVAWNRKALREVKSFPEEIKNQYGLNGLLDRENQLVTNELIQGYLNQAYQKHFNAENR